MKNFQASNLAVAIATTFVIVLILLFAKSVTAQTTLEYNKCETNDEAKHGSWAVILNADSNGNVIVYNDNIKTKFHFDVQTPWKEHHADTISWVSAVALLDTSAVVLSYNKDFFRIYARGHLNVFTWDDEYKR